MRKVDRLFEIVQLLRGKRLRTAAFIAEKLGVSVRTVYRDIQGLRASGVPIEGERGVGYIIRQPIEMPPLRFTPLELKALCFGIDMVANVADRDVVRAVREAEIKIKEVLPYRVSGENDSLGHIFYRVSDFTRENLALLRKALGEKRKLHMTYRNEELSFSERTVRVLGFEYWGKVWTFTAWCELRDDFRMFRVDRIESCDLTDEVFKEEKGKTYKDILRRYEVSCSGFGMSI